MLLIIAGMRRSGSTLAYQIARHLVGPERALRRIEKLPHMVEARPNWYVVKTHRFQQEWARKVHTGNVRVVVTIRDPRDIAVSMRSLWDLEKNLDLPFGEISRKIGWEVQQQSLWEEKTPYHSFLWYEDFFNNPSILVYAISRVLEMELDDAEVEMISEQYSFDSNKKRSNEILKTEDDFMFPGHTRDGIVGKWRIGLWPHEADEIVESVGKEWMNKHGYRQWNQSPF